MRHGFKHGRNGNPIAYAVAGVVVIVAVIAWLAPNLSPVPQAMQNKASQGNGLTTQSTQGVQDGNQTKTDTGAVLAIAKERCIMCHGEAMQMKNIRLDSAELLEKNAALVYQQVVVTKLMPMNNATGITPAERQAIATWFESQKK